MVRPPPHTHTHTLSRWATSCCRPPFVLGRASLSVRDAGWLRARFFF